MLNIYRYFFVYNVHPVLCSISQSPRDEFRVHTNTAPLYKGLQQPQSLVSWRLSRRMTLSFLTKKGQIRLLISGRRCRTQTIVLVLWGNCMWAGRARQSGINENNIWLYNLLRCLKFLMCLLCIQKIQSKPLSIILAKKKFSSNILKSFFFKGAKSLLLQE